jgi:hypothetical protein
VSEQQPIRQGGFVARVARGATSRFHSLRELIDATRDWNGIAMWITGSEKHSGEALSVFCFGSDEPAQILSALFTDYSVQRQERAPMWSLRSQFARAGASTDLMVGDVPWPYYLLLPDAPFLHVPGWVAQRLALPERFETVIDGFRKKSKTTDLKKIRKHQLDFRVRHSRAEVEHFYDTMYVPFAQRRFGPLALVDTRADVVAAAAREGLLQVVQGERVVGAGILSRFGASMHFLWLGLPEGLDDALMDGTMAALYYFTIVHAHALGCAEVYMGYTAPLLNGGVYQYKRKWGTSVHDEWLLDETVLRPMNFGAAVTSVLRREPLIVRQAAGLVGKVLVTDESLSASEVTGLASRFASRGLQSLKIFSTCPLAEEVTQSPYPSAAPVQLIDLSSSADPALDFCRL